MLGVRDDEDREYRKSLRRSTDILRPVVRGSFLVTGGRGLTGSIVNMVLDYLRIFFHLDLIKFFGNQRTIMAAILFSLFILVPALYQLHLRMQKAE